MLYTDSSLYGVLSKDESGITTIGDLLEHGIFAVQNDGESKYIISAENNVITSVGAPTSDNDAATKKYVDTAVAQAGGTPEYSLTDKVKGIKSGFIIINDNDTLYPSLYCQYGEEGSAIVITADGRFYKKPFTNELTFDDLMIPANAFVDPGDEYLVTNLYAKNNYVHKTDYTTLSQKVTELESKVTSLTETITQLQSTITQIQGNVLTTLDRQTLDVLENKSDT